MSSDLLFPAAIIDSDVELEQEESDEDDEHIDREAVTVRKKKKLATAADEFSRDFVFEATDGNDAFVDETEDLQKYLKKTAPSTLEEKIEEMRRKRNTNAVVEIEVEKEEDEKSEQKMENSDDEVEQLGGREVRDTLREKKRSGGKKRPAADAFFDEEIGKDEGEDLIAFDQMNLSRPILKAIGAAQFAQPTPIQSACIPVALAGRDICACAATGTGKTAAFVLPILERLLYKSGQRCTRVLVLVPTRELAIQVFQVFRKLATYQQIEVCLCAGGLDVKTQEAALRSSPDVVVATPGRLIDHLHNSPSFTLATVEVLVLDEADRMLEEAFADQMKELIRLCAKNRQTLLFSATMTDEIDELATMSLKKPVKIFINENTETALKLRQEFVRIRSGRERDREPIVAALVTRTFQQNTIVFVKTKVHCQRMQILLGLLGIKVGQMHSNLSQAQRVGALTKFKKGEIDVLVSTDLASRGLDIEGVQTVINMNMPKTIKQYIHRVGRTARAGKAGRSISLVGEEERKLLKEIIQANPNKAMKQRVIATGTVEAYRKRVDDLEESIKEIVEAERVERELRIAEATTAKAQQKLENPNEPERVWFQKKTQADKEKARIEKKKLREEERKRKEADKTPEEKRLEETAAFQLREAKRRRKGKHTRLRTIVDEDEIPKWKRNNQRGKGGKSGGAKVKASASLSEIPSIQPSGHIQKKNNNNIVKKQSGGGGKGKKSFTKELASVGRRSVKAARHGPEDSQFQKARVSHRLKTKKR